MLTAENFIERWGEADLFRFPPSLLRNVNISTQTKSFLCNAGLPVSAVLAGSHCVLLPTKPLADGSKMLLSTLTFASPHYRMLMTHIDGPQYYAIEEGNEQIRVLYSAAESATPHTIEYLDILVNSSLSQFLEFILAERNFWIKSMLYISDEGNYPAIWLDTLEQQWKEIDPRVMARTDTWWTGYLEDTRLQLGFKKRSFL